MQRSSSSVVFPLLSRAHLRFDTRVRLALAEKLIRFGQLPHLECKHQSARRSIQWDTLCAAAMRSLDRSTELLRQRCLSSGQSRDRDPKGTATDIIQSGAVTEFDRVRIPAMLAANAE